MANPTTVEIFSRNPIYKVSEESHHKLPRLRDPALPLTHGRQSLSQTTDTYLSSHRSDPMGRVREPDRDPQAGFKRFMCEPYLIDGRSYATLASIRARGTHDRTPGFSK